MFPSYECVTDSNFVARSPGSDSSYVPIGCFQDNRVRGRPLPEMVGNHRNNIDWHNMSSTVNKCAQDAWRNKYAVFGVQFYGECWSGITGYKTYDKDGFNLHGCWEGVGRSLNNYVYAFTSTYCIIAIIIIITMNLPLSPTTTIIISITISSASYYPITPPPPTPSLPSPQLQSRQPHHHLYLP